MKTVREILQLSATYLEKYQVKSPRFNAEELLAHVLKVKRIELYFDIDKPIEEKELEIYRDLIRRRSKGEPLDYLLGERQFDSLVLRVNPSVLIPRQETEQLVDLAAKELKEEILEGKALWDVCAGSGCIGLSLKKRFPQLNVALSDISEEALKVARENAERNSLEVEILQGDMLQPFKGRKVDFLISNPPYIAQSAFENLEREVKLFEPSIALIGGETGTEYYKKLESVLPNYLNPRGKVFFEIGYDQGEALLELFRKPFWKKQRIIKDYAGHDRFFFLEME